MKSSAGTESRAAPGKDAQHQAARIATILVGRSTNPSQGGLIMKDTISCTRCGNAQSVSVEALEDWDEISCSECGDFLDTVGHWTDSHAPNYSMQILNQCRSLTLKMARENRPLNDHYPTLRATA
ncbi:hypothetical protein [Salinicola socius]|uniref:hypothetical protein n=1 Tax=Salinicola socius TaxID=404433 RepID=UPI001182D1D6|nr:hypothetical protein [Salinicola socius]